LTDREPVAYSSATADVAGPSPREAAPAIAFDDSELVARIARGDEHALRLVVELHGASVYGMAVGLLKNGPAADEVAQETFLALWLDPTRIESSKGNLRAFLRGVARYKAIDWIRREEARRYRESAAGITESVEDFATELGERVDHERQVDAALDQLTPIQREAVIVTYFGDTTCSEAAETLGIPLGTLKTRLRDALMHLRRICDVPEAGS